MDDFVKNLLETGILLNYALEKDDIPLITGIIHKMPSSLLEKNETEILSKCKSMKSMTLLLEHDVDLAKVNMITLSCDQKVMIRNIIVNTIIKVKINPNIIRANGRVLWHDICSSLTDTSTSNTSITSTSKTSRGIDIMNFIKYTGPNFTECINKDAQNINGNTFLHMLAYATKTVDISSLLRDFLELGPDPHIFNDKLCIPLDVAANTMIENYTNTFKSAIAIAENTRILGSNAIKGSGEKIEMHGPVIVGLIRMYNVSQRDGRKHRLSANLLDIINIDMLRCPKIYRMVTTYIKVIKRYPTTTYSVQSAIRKVEKKIAKLS